MKKEEQHKQIAEELWALLDSIDTLPDMIHPSNEEGHEKCWKMMVKRAEKRHDLLKSDGYNLTIIEETQRYNISPKRGNE